MHLNLVKGKLVSSHDIWFLAEGAHVYKIAYRGVYEKQMPR
jgi:hypothetical protein